MNLEELNELVSNQRKESFATSHQITVGELIKQLENTELMYDENEYKSVYFDFGSAIPTNIDSWRGSYDELALGYELTGYDSKENAHFSDCKADKLLEELKSAIGKTYTGWKGGDFIMSENTPIWVANSGNSGNTGIIGVLDEDWCIIILTAFCKY